MLFLACMMISACSEVSVPRSLSQLPAGSEAATGGTAQGYPGQGVS